MTTLFDKFDGVRPMAEHLSEPPSTVQSWKTNGRIPAHKQPGVLRKARELGLPVTAEDVIFPMGSGLDHDASDTVPSAAQSSNSSRQIIGQVPA